MNEIEELIKVLRSITATLDRMAENEKKFDLDTCMYLEHLSHDTHRMASNLSELTQS